jgi:hypothetical protein
MENNENNCDYECKKIIDNLENLKKKLIEIKKKIDDNEILLLNIIEKKKYKFINK